jgi:RNA polymerase sigma factor (sigma-70 family)
MAEAEGRLKGKGREFRSPAAYKNFLYTIFKNALIDHLRERQRARVRTEPLDDRDGAEGMAEPPAVSRPAVVEAARRILAELTREERRLLTLRYMRNKTLVEVGKVLDLSKSTVDRREKLLEQKLFRMIDSEGGVMDDDCGPVLALVLDLIGDKESGDG